MSKVRYLDFDTDHWYHPQEYPHGDYNFITPYIHKRNEFKHENEFRLYHKIEDAISSEEYWNIEKQAQTHKGIYVNVNLNLLIEKVILPPTIDDRTEKIIRSLTKQLGFNFPFEISKLKNKPYY